VLIVEDEPLVAITTLSALEAAHYDICGAASTSAEALRLAASTPPDLALIDIQLANGRTGLDLARELRSRFGTICLLTTGWLADDELVGLEVPAVLQKPYSDTELVAAVAACLELATGVPPLRLPRGMFVLQA
jgi:DNA-binding response OmpR family regulator